MALTPEKIAQLLSKGRTRGAGIIVLADFIQSGSAGEPVSLTDGPFAGKTAKQSESTLNASKKQTDDSGKLVVEGAQHVRVIRDGDELFVINTAVAL